MAPRGLKCSVRYFDKICENLDTRPVFLKHLINNISRSFYARENKLGHFHLRHNLSDAYYFAKVLCMLKHQLIVNRLFSQLNILFELTSNLFCDIVFFTDISCSFFRKYICKNTIRSSKLFTLCATHFKILHQKMMKYILCSQFFVHPRTLDTRLISRKGETLTLLAHYK